MNTNSMTSLERVLTALSFREPDRVPLFLLLTMHGAKELDTSIEEYYSNSNNVTEGQIKLREKFEHDCYYPFFYAGIEFEAWGGEVLFSKDGPPNAGAPIINNASQIDHLILPKIAGNPPLQKVLKTISDIKSRTNDDAPIIGVVMSPISLPVMQMGFEKYLDLMIEQPAQFNKLITLNETFCIEWANAQVAAGATAICYFDPVSSVTVITPEMYELTGFQIAKRVISKINAPTATHFASGRCLPIISKVAETGTAIIGFGMDEDPGEIKEKSYGKLSMLGNLNGIEMRRWTPSEAEMKVKELISKAAPGGGFLLSDSHGEIPYQVPDEVIFAISEAVRTWGTYPLK